MTWRLSNVVHICVVRGSAYKACSVTAHRNMADWFTRCQFRRCVHCCNRQKQILRYSRLIIQHALSNARVVPVIMTLVRVVVPSRAIGHLTLVMICINAVIAVERCPSRLSVCLSQPNRGSRRKQLKRVAEILSS